MPWVLWSGKTAPTVLLSLYYCELGGDYEWNLEGRETEILIILAAGRGWWEEEPRFITLAGFVHAIGNILLNHPS
ncbi:hypothetical protein ACFL6T_00245 [Candidatus Zixiibacteriota bacterium]